jgi:7-carboxy-7-deazaguanine synthase
MSSPESLTVHIAEIFESIQGEGPWAGTPSLFIRTAGCNLRCWFCDTPYTSWQPTGVPKSVSQLLESVRKAESSHVVLTGGEPMLCDELIPLTAGCRELGRLVTIETAGTVDLDITCDLMAISPKLENSVPMDAVWSSRHDRTRHRPHVIRSLLDRYQCVLKFVVDQPADLTEIQRYVAAVPNVTAQQVWLMPQARTREQLNATSKWLRPLADQLGYQYSSRLQIEQFGNQRGT